MEVKNITGVQVAKNSLWKFCESIGVQIIQLAVTIILARLLTPDDYGVMAIIVVAASFLSLFVNNGIPSYLVYAKNITKEDFYTALIFNVLVAIFLTFLLILSATTIANYYEAPTIRPMIIAMSATIPMASVSAVYNAYAMKMSLFKTLFIRNMIAGPVSGIVALLLAFNGFGVWALIGQQLLYNILLAVIVVLTIRVNVEGEWRLSLNRLKSMIGFGIFTSLSTIIAFISDSISDLVIGKKISSAQLGIYSRGNHFPNTIFSSINSVVSTVLFPAFASYNQDIANLKDKFHKTIKFLYSVSFPILFGLIACASPMIKFLLTDKWMECVPVIQIVCFYFMAIPFLQAASQIMLAVGSVKLRMLGEIVKMILTFLFLFLLITNGILGVAIARVLVGWFMVLYSVIIFRFVMSYGFCDLIKDLIKPFIASFIMALLIYPVSMLSMNSVLILIVQVVLGVFVYLCSSKIIHNDELFEVIKLFYGHLHKSGK